MKLIANARQWWRLWSVRLNSAGLALLLWVQIDPSATLMVWLMMPDPIRAALPDHFVTWVSIALFVLALIARVVVQPKLKEGEGT